MDVYAIVASAASFFSLAIGFVWIFRPQTILTAWGVAQPSTAKIVERRFGALFVCVAVILFFARHAPPSSARSAISAGIVVGCALLFVQNAISLHRREIGRDIVPGMLLQAAMVAGFLLAEGSV